MTAFVNETQGKDDLLENFDTELWRKTDDGSFFHDFDD